MSKWINKELFNSFQKEKIEEKETPSVTFNRSDLLWDTPDKGTIEQPKIYEGRFVPDPKGEFYKRYYYHFWQSGESWIFVLCSKTHDFKNYCPFCSAVNKLYNGTKQDKAQAYLLKRKERFVGNFYVAKDPRDSDRDEEKKVVGKIKLYEFPSQVEKKLKNEITDREQGYGYHIFDPDENGRNFILKVLSTKKQEDGRQWPDYSSSTFSRTQSPLGSESEIDELMASCIDLVDYIKSMDKTKDEQVEILKNEFLWQIIEDEAGKYGYIYNSNKEESNVESSETSDSVPSTTMSSTESEEDNFDSKEGQEQEEENEENRSDDDIDDDDLLAELDNM